MTCTWEYSSSTTDCEIGRVLKYLREKEGIHTINNPRDTLRARLLSRNIDMWTKFVMCYFLPHRFAKNHKYVSLFID